MKKRFQVLAQTAKCLITRCARHLGFIIMNLQILLEIQVFLADKIPISSNMYTQISKWQKGSPRKNSNPKCFKRTNFDRFTKYVTIYEGAERGRTIKF